MQLDFTQVKKVKLLENPKYYVAIVALFRNEDRFLKEWIEFYKLMGVEHFYLFNHLSDDNYMAVLDPYIKEGTIDLVNLTFEPANKDEWYEFIHFPTYLNTTRSVENEVEWLIIVDTDEFLFPIKEQNLTSVLREYDDYASLTVNWKKFGSNGVQKVQNNELMTEQLVMRDSIPDLLVKNIVKPRYVESFTNPHFAIMKAGYGQITENYQFINGAHVASPSNNILTINHYQYRDWEFFYSTKISRVHLMDSHLSDVERYIKINNLIEDNERYSSVYDDNILRFSSALRLQVFKNQSFLMKDLEAPHNNAMYYLPNNLVFVVGDNKIDGPLSLKNGYGYEPYITKRLMAFSKYGETYVEVGASYGEFPLQMSTKLGDVGKVYAFEPNNMLFQYLSINRFFNNISNIELSQESNDIMNLDAYFNNSSVDIIRINVDGKECEIIQGAENIIDSSPDLRIFIKWQSGSMKCLTDLSNKGFIFINIKEFNEECSYLVHQVNYHLSINDILDSNAIEILAIKEDTFESYRKSYSNTTACTMLANKMMFNAALQGRSSEVEYCLSNGAEINYYDDKLSGPALYYTISQGHTDTVRLLLNKGADVEFGYKKMVTPLFIAAEYGRYEIVEMLLDYGANKEFTLYGKYPAQIALDNGHAEVAHLLLGESFELMN